MICCKLTYFNRGFQYQKKLIVFTVYSFQIKKRFVSYFQNVENVGATELIKDEAKITLKNGNKGQKRFTKINFDFCQEKTKRKTNVVLCCVQRDYVGYIGWKNLESYVEMVAGLPINEQINDQELLRAN